MKRNLMARGFNEKFFTQPFSNKSIKLWKKNYNNVNYIDLQLKIMSKIWLKPEKKNSRYVIRRYVVSATSAFTSHRLSGSIRSIASTVFLFYSTIDLRPRLLGPFLALSEITRSKFDMSRDATNYIYTDDGFFVASLTWLSTTFFLIAQLFTSTYNLS